MIPSRLLAGAGMALVLGFGGQALAQGPADPGGGPPGPVPVKTTIVDGWKLQSGGISNTWTTQTEAHEFNASLDAFATPAGFVSATVYLDEPHSSGISDAFTLLTNPADPGHVSAYFISDGASAAEIAAMQYSSNAFHLTETGQWQDVSAYFGQQPGFARIISDVPEPSSWALMLLGLGAVGAAMRRTRRRRPAAAAA